MNTFVVIFDLFNHRKGKEEESYYKLGSATYFIFFFVQSIALFGTYIFAWVVYIKLAIFLKPVSSEKNGEDAADDDRYEDLNKSKFERNRDVIRRKFRSKYLTFNVSFAYLLITLTLRTGTYIG